jgi:chitodextrinase
MREHTLLPRAFGRLTFALAFALLLNACSDSPSDPTTANESGSMNAADAASAASKDNAFRGRFVLQFAEDVELGEGTTTDMLELDDGSLLELRFRGRRPDINPGARIRVRGERRNGSIEVADGSVESDETFFDVTSTIATTSTTRRVAIVLFNFSNNTAQPYTPAHAAGIAFTNTNSVAAYYRSNSWDNVNLVGDVYGWFTIADVSTAGCNYSTWASSANMLAAAAGIDLSASRYEHVVYAFPATSTCSWSGMGNLPGRLSYLNGSGMSLRTMAHELGHNLGTHHASTYRCTESGVRVSLSLTSSNCTRSEYGDPFSIMGASTRRHTNPSLANFAWLPPANRLDVSQSGDYRLAPLHSADGIQSIRIQRTSTSFLTLEFRASAGPFDAFSSSDPVVNGVTIRVTGGDLNRTQSLLIDATPSTTSFGDAPLAAGHTFLDPMTGVSVTTLGVSAAGADVRISFGGDTDPPPAPDTDPPTQPGSFKATALDASRIALSWTASSDNIGVSGYRVFRGATLVGTVTGTSFTDTGLSPATSYSYQVLAFDAAGNTSTPANASATTMTVDATPPSAPSNLTGTVGKGKKVTLTWNPSTDNVGVAGYQVFRDGKLVATVTGTSHNDSLPGGKNPSASYYVVAFDAAGNVSGASNTVVVRG